MRRPAPNQAYRAMDILHHRFTKLNQLLTSVVPLRYPSSQNSSRSSTPTTSGLLPPHSKNESLPDISGFQTPSVYNTPQLPTDSVPAHTVTEPDTMRASVAPSNVSLVVCTRSDTMRDTAPTEDSYDAVVATKRATSRCDALSEEPFRAHDATETTSSPPVGNQRRLRRSARIATRMATLYKTATSAHHTVASAPNKTTWGTTSKETGTLTQTSMEMESSRKGAYWIIPKQWEHVFGVDEVCQL